MPVLNVRGVPEVLMRECKVVATLRGQTLRSFIIECMEQGVREEKEKVGLKQEIDVIKVEKELDRIDGLAKRA